MNTTSDAPVGRAVQSDLERQTILIVDDQPANLAVIVDYLERHSFIVLVSQDGESGLKRARYALPDLILLDVMMPGIDGFETCRRLKAIAETKDISVIFMTALTNVADKVRGFEVGGVDYITKPIQVGEVLARVKTHLALRNMQKQIKAKNVQLRQEITERKQAEAALQRAHDELEQRVEQRTAELAKANDNLKTEMTERQQVEEQLRQAQKMEAIGRLTGGVAHDFNNILTVIIGNSHFILDDLGQSHPLRQDIEQIRMAAERAAALTRQLLAFSRQQVLQPEVLNLNSVVSNIEKMLQRLIGEDIALKTILEAQLGQIRVDSGQIGQVIMNLAVNARDSMIQGGKLTIETANIHLGEAYVRQHVGVTAGPYIMLAVSDTGIGMDAETQTRIFEPFFSTKERERGTGLGLATVHGIINQSGGHIWVYSELGHGTVFKIYLPQIEAAAELTRRKQPPVKSRRGWETVLLVEDEKAVQELARRTLLRDGYTVLEADDGEQARRVAAEHKGPIHLLLSDVVMPGGMSGPQLAEYLTPLYPKMKVLYISGYTDNAIARHGVLNPGAAFLQKPFTPNTLAHKVRQVLDAISH